MLQARALLRRQPVREPDPRMGPECSLTTLSASNSLSAKMVLLLIIR